MKRNNCETRREIYAEELGCGYDPVMGKPYIDIAPFQVMGGKQVELPPRRVFFGASLRVLGDGKAFRLGNLERGGIRHTWAEALSRKITGLTIARVPVEGSEISARQRALLIKR